MSATVTAVMKNHFPSLISNDLDDMKYNCRLQYNCKALSLKTKANSDDFQESSLFCSHQPRMLFDSFYPIGTDAIA